MRIIAGTKSQNVLPTELILDHLNWPSDFLLSPDAHHRCLPSTSIASHIIFTTCRHTYDIADATGHLGDDLFESMMLYAKPIQPKPVKSRSRAGCKYCSHSFHSRDKRKKCSEEKPQCSRCVQFGVECVYEPIKKRKKRTTKFTVPSPPDAGSTPGSSGPSTAPSDPTSHQQHVQQPHLHQAYFEPGQTPEGLASFLDPWAAGDTSMSDSTTGTSPSLLGYDDAALGENTYQIGTFDLAGANVCGTQAEVIPSLAWSPQIEEHLLPWPFLAGHMDWGEQQQQQQQHQPILAPVPPVHMPWLAPASPRPRGSFSAVADPIAQTLDHNALALIGLPALAEVEEDWATEQTLGAVLLLVYYEMLLQRGPTNLIGRHMQQVWRVLEKVHASENPRLDFFREAFGYFDVIHALSSGTAPCAPSPPSVHSHTLISALDSSISAISGFTADLWPTLHRLASLPCRQSDQSLSRDSHASTEGKDASDERKAALHKLEQVLIAWEPALPPGYTLVNRVVDGPEDAPEDEVARIRVMTSKALACKQSALIVLNRERDAEAVQRHARAALWHCVSATGPHLPPGRGTGAGMLWALFEAACEAGDGRDRGLARQAFAAVEAARGVVNAAKAWEVVVEVWRRRDLAKAGGRADPGGGGWRRIAEEMGFSLVFG
ncbi:L-arabinose-responsive transcription regulator ARA1 like protein [Verticillium longisporum]|nr:L-arabinose-responsive transcription regulator ARA1 like protein [Verticillium longisporum]